MNKTPLLIIGIVLTVAVIGGAMYYNSSKANPAPTANSNKPTNAAPAAKTSQQTIPPNAPAGANPPEQMGSPNAAVTLEEFADFQCGSCAMAHPTMNEIKSMYGSRIHFIYRNFPLKIPAHDKAYEASLAASAAGMQNKFWDMQNMLFSNQKTWTADPTYKQIWKGYAQKIGLDVAKWESDINGFGARNRVEADIARGTAINITSTPTLFINGVAVPYSDMRVEALKPLIDAELQKSTGQNPASDAPAGGESSNK
jgi:protein-disulfide isomerase